MSDMRIHATDVVIRQSQRFGARDIAMLAVSTATLIVAGATGFLFLISCSQMCGGFEYDADSSGELVIARTGGAVFSMLYRQETRTDHGEVFIERCLVDATEHPIGLHVQLVRDGPGRYRTSSLLDTIGETCRLGENATVYLSIIHADRTAAVRYDRHAATAR